MVKDPAETKRRSNEFSMWWFQGFWAGGVLGRQRKRSKTLGLIRRIREGLRRQIEKR